MSESEYNVQELDGCTVVTTGGDVLGVLKDVFATGANDVFVVRGPLREYLIPALKTVVLNIDLRERRITVELPEGLREVYEA